MTDKPDFPETITIPTPLYDVIPRGVHAHGAREVAFNVRLSDDERAQIKQAADHIGVPSAQFMRWVAIAAAKEIIRAQRSSERDTVQPGRDAAEGGRKML